MPKLLIIDDEAGVRYSLERGLESSELEVVGAETAREGLRLVRDLRPDAVVLDVRLPDMSGLDAFDRIHETDPHLPVVIITAYATTETAIEAMKRGAFEYLLKPLDLAQLRQVVDRAIETSRLSRVPAVIGDDEADTATPGDRIVGRSPAMQDVYKAIGRVAAQDVTVLVLGESGTGKELVARAIYHYGNRRPAPFLAINCAAIPEPLLESELFGHERGAFTGAERRRIGKFEQADGGTVFLDEIGDMTPATQAKILRLLQERTFERVGSNESLRVDVRIIAATHRDLDEAVSSGEFRQDLYYRLNDYVIRLPPLRERIEDLPLLVEHFIGTLNRQLAKQVRVVAPEALSALKAYHWPGNVRELQSAIKHALVQAPGEVLTPDLLPSSVHRPAASPGSAPRMREHGPRDLTRMIRDRLATNEPGVYEDVHAQVDRILLREVLDAAEGNQVEAARRLGISRNTLRSRLRGLGITIEKRVEPAPSDGIEPQPPD